MSRLKQLNGFTAACYLCIVFGGLLELLARPLEEGWPGVLGFLAVALGVGFLGGLCLLGFVRWPTQ
jgi:hypothetical protein